MCDNFECRYCYLDLGSSGAVIKSCHMHNTDLAFLDCDCCFFKDCSQCRKCSGSCSDKALNYFKEVLRDGEKHKVFIV